MVNMIYDIFRLRGCTSVLLRGPNGEIYHGHNTDIGWGMDWPKTIMVKYHPTGYHSFVTITWAGFLGTQTAYNAKGLCYSEDTLSARRKNPRGFSVNFLARIIMEECRSIPETIPVFYQYGTVNGEALVLNDGAQPGERVSNGGIAETTPLSPVRWAWVPLTDQALWGINLYADPEFASDIQDNRLTDNGFNRGRVKILRHFFANQPPDPKFTLDDAIGILRSSIGPDGKDLAKSAFQEGVCNASTQQMIIYDPYGQGVYLAVGPYFASRNAVLFYPDDFATPPHIYGAATTPEPVIAESARLLNSVTSGEDSYRQWRKLAIQYSHEAFIHVYTGWAAFAVGEMDIWAGQIAKAYQLEPDLPEHQIQAAGVAYYHRDHPRVITILNTMKWDELSTGYRALGLAILVKACHFIDQNMERSYVDKLRLLLKSNKPLKSSLNRYLKHLESVKSLKP